MGRKIWLGLIGLIATVLVVILLSRKEKEASTVPSSALDIEQEFSDSPDSDLSEDSSDDQSGSLDPSDSSSPSDSSPDPLPDSVKEE